MKYSFNLDKRGIVFAHMKDINASFKDLGAVCDAIRYRSIPNAINRLDNVIINEQPILYRKHNRYMGSRHELGGRKGRTPKRCAAIIRKVLVNAMANATNQGLDPEGMFVVHATANKTIIAKRGPPKGMLFTQQGIYGYQPSRSMNLELAKVEIGISQLDDKVLNDNMMKLISRFQKAEKKSGLKKIRMVKQEIVVPKKPEKKSIIQKNEPKQEKAEKKEQHQHKPESQPSSPAAPQKQKTEEVKQ